MQLLSNGRMFYLSMYPQYQSEYCIYVNTPAVCRSPKESKLLAGAKDEMKFHSGSQLQVRLN
jgi:hypothetical protein